MIVREFLQWLRTAPAGERADGATALARAYLFSPLSIDDRAAADVAPFSIDRIVARHGHLAAIRESLLGRDDLPAPTRQLLVAKLSQTLASFVTARAWLGKDRAQRVAMEACEKATVALAGES